MKPYDFRNKGDKGGFQIVCDSCGQTSYVSADHGRYCPICTKDVITPITVTKIVPEGTKKLYVSFSVSGRYVAEIEYPESTDGELSSDDVKSIIEKATHKYWDADFGALEDIDSCPVHITDEDGNFVWEQ